MMNCFTEWTRVAAFFFFLNTLIGCGKDKTNGNPGPSDSSVVVPPAQQAGDLPSIKGKLVFHSYKSYGDPSQMFIYDFSKKQLSCISSGWNLHNPINAHFNPDGTQIVFMAEATPGGKWDIYIWTVDSKNSPVNLTSEDKSRDEDPKFSPDGKNICFKQTDETDHGNIMVMDLKGNILKKVTGNKIESGMPYYLFNSPFLVYASGAGSESDIFMVNEDGTNNHAIEHEKNIQEYYPVIIDSSSYLFSRWYSASNKNDQVYRGYFSGSPSVSLPFNTSNANYSDPYPYGADHVFLSSTRAGTKGGYDLYIANIKTGAISSLTSYNPDINTSNNELGASFCN